MSDFLIHFNGTPLDKDKIISSMKYFEDIHVREYDYKLFSLFLSRPDDLDIWGPFETNGGNLMVALAGRVALENREWEEARRVEGPGGLACKAIYNKYRSGGIRELEKLNGNFAVLVIDAEKPVVYIVSDRCGMFPCYHLDANNRTVMIGSHPDIMAAAANVSQDWDMVSITEFLMTGMVSYPCTYYNRIRALDYGSIHEVRFDSGKGFTLSSSKYFEFNFNIDDTISEWELAEELALAFRKAVNRRTLPLFGQTAISLSGGLDSRTLLCSADDRKPLWAFCFYDMENLEYRTAKQIAQTAGVKLISLKRDFDHYADSAEMGVRISGGQGNFANNHYLGFRTALKEHGITNILTGCYCDYFFKGLTLDIRMNRYLKIERLSGFKDGYYHPFIGFDTGLSKQVRDRLNDLFPEDLRDDNSDAGRLEKEQKRLLPLSNEADNAMRLIPQRVMPWYLPIVDNDIVDVYLKVLPKHKLNTSLFSKMAKIQCGVSISKIPNSNTGVRVNAPIAGVIISLYKMALLKRINKEGIATVGSWPNWEYYIENSRKIESLWMRNNGRMRDLFREMLGEDPYEKSPREYTMTDASLTLFLRLLTLKLWLEQRG